jgi:protocatechuate 3,4-dioxygenase beta subunit
MRFIKITATLLMLIGLLASWVVGSDLKSLSTLHRSEALKTLRSSPVLLPAEKAALIKSAEGMLASYGSITGIVSGLDDSALNTAYVSAFPADSIIGGEILSKGWSSINPDGSYRMDSLLVGKYYVYAWADGYVFKYYDNALDIIQATTIPVEDGVTTDGINFRMERIPHGTGGISGTVTGEKDQQPIASATVSVFSSDAHYGYGWVQTDRNGNYQITDLNSGSYYVQVWADGYLFEYYDNAFSLADARLVRVTEPQETGKINFQLAPGGIISGTVTNEDGKPLAEIYLEAVTVIRDSTVIDSTGANGGSIGFTGIGKAVSDLNGHYSITGLPSDTFYVRAMTWNGWVYTEEWYKDAASLEGASPIVVKSGEEILEIDFQLSIAAATGVIAGKVTDQQNNPVRDAYVQVQSKEDASGQIPVWVSVVTDRNGEYRFAGLPNGSYYVYAWAQSGWQYVQRWWQDSETQEGATPVVIDGSTDPGPIDFRLPLTIGNASISGIIKSGDGRFLAGVSVQVTSTNSVEPSTGVTSTLWAWGYTDSSGYYQVDRLPAGSYIIYASIWENTSFGQQWYDHADSLADADLVNLTNDAKRTDINFDLTLRPMYGSISGTVIDSLTGLPISRAYVEIASRYSDLYMSLRPFRFWNYYAITDDNGKYQLDWLWEGEYLVSVFANGSFEYYDNAAVADLAQPVKVTGGTATEVNFALVSGYGGTGEISGKVTSDWEGTEMEIAVITAKPTVMVQLWPFSAMFYTAVASKDGSYEMKGLPPGEYYVQSFAPWHVGEYYDNVYDPLQATVVKVDGSNPTSGIDFSLSPMLYLWDKGRDMGMNGSASILGTVLDSNGKPLGDASIYLLDENGQAVSFARTNADGSYQLLGLPPGNYVLQAAMVGFESQFNGNTASYSQAIPLQVGNNSLEVNFSLAPQTSTGMQDRDTTQLPKTVELYGNYPNPFNPETRISFALPKEMEIKLSIYNIHGGLVTELYDGTMSSGAHLLTWDGRFDSGEVASSGLYFAVLSGPNVRKSLKLLLVK